MAKRKKKGTKKKVRPQNPVTPNVDEDDELGPLEVLTEELTYEDPIETQTFAPLDPIGDESEFDEQEVAGELPTDEDGYLDPETALVQDEAVTGTVVVQDFDPTDPGAEIAEPQKVLKPHDRIARKRARGSRE